MRRTSARARAPRASVPFGTGLRTGSSEFIVCAIARETDTLHRKLGPTGTATHEAVAIRPKVPGVRCYTVELRTSSVAKWLARLSQMPL